mmetsp:Transcript_33538/g.99935  ORF Transcript_33538/g.99935 Transcript_33538/m.99935 type:complete len:433 (-) Transcript_33538:452-1750(-)
MKVYPAAVAVLFAAGAPCAALTAFVPSGARSTPPFAASSARLSAHAGAETKEWAAGAVEFATPERYTIDHPSNNVPPHIAELVGRGLHLKEDHPIGIIRAKIQEYFAGLDDDFTVFDAEDPIVTTTQCFDDLRIPPEHPGRSPSDTYYITDETLLRTHTSAHQSQHLREGHECFLCTGDVYRRDEIDASHYPAFHQLEGVKLFDEDELKVQDLDHDEWIESGQCKMIGDDLKKTLEGLMDHLFGPCEKRWADDYFPFTEPSFEMEIMYEGEWLEVLGCGVVHTEVLSNVNMPERHGWAFGLGLERLAMILFKIPDIRLFWTDDERFSSQFKAGDITTFEPYSKYPPVFKDIAFWTPEGYVENDFFELARGVAGDLVERIECTDEFTNPKTGKSSKCYRIAYRSMDRSLTNEEINELQDNLRDRSAELELEVR